MHFPPHSSGHTGRTFRLITPVLTEKSLAGPVPAFLPENMYAALATPIPGQPRILVSVDSHYDPFYTASFANRSIHTEDCKDSYPNRLFSDIESSTSSDDSTNANRSNINSASTSNFAHEQRVEEQPPTRKRPLDVGNVAPWTAIKRRAVDSNASCSNEENNKRTGDSVDPYLSSSDALRSLSKVILDSLGEYQRSVSGLESDFDSIIQSATSAYIETRDNPHFELRNEDVVKASTLLGDLSNLKQQLHSARAQIDDLRSEKSRIPVDLKAYGIENWTRQINLLSEKIEITKRELLITIKTFLDKP